MTTWFFAALLFGLNAHSGAEDALIGLEPDPAQVSLGRSVFATQWAVVGAPGVPGRFGLGPLYNAASCNACHRQGARGEGPAGDGPVPAALVVQLESPTRDAGGEPRGDPVYGRVFNTAAIDTTQVEGTVTVRYTETAGYYYPYGGRWTLRVPHYQLGGLNHGPLAADTVIKPRLAPALFGAGLLEAVPESEISEGAGPAGGRTAGTLAWHTRDGKRVLGRLGWQGGAVSVRDQTTNAFAREMGLTSDDRLNDDCTPAEMSCRAPAGAAPEVSEELLTAVVAFVRTLTVPVAPTRTDSDSLGSELFANIGCPACHRPRLTVQLPRPDGIVMPAVIAPYTDLRLHDLGPDMADENASGAKVQSRWRTAPLWGLGYRLKEESHPTFLHDGRAVSTEEAILWHSGEAAYARHKFMNLGPHAREAVLQWLATL
jgi:CxxC motif-containing protein (DUF1111 family)